MGYTHYWTFSKPKSGTTDEVNALYIKAIKACNKVVKMYQREAKSYDRLSGYSAHCKEGQYGGIEVNGKQELSHEPFVLREHYKQNIDNDRRYGMGGFNFCKTAHKPYDTVVTACLVVLKHYLGNNVDVSSDGDPEEWTEGMLLATRATRLVTLKNPIEREKEVEDNVIKMG